MLLKTTYTIGYSVFNLLLADCEFLCNFIFLLFTKSNNEYSMDILYSFVYFVKARKNPGCISSHGSEVANFTLQFLESVRFICIPDSNRIVNL